MSRAPLLLLIAAILATVAGGLGGSFQPARIILSMILPIILLRPTIIQSLTLAAVRALWFVASIVMCGTLSLAWSEDLIGGIGLIMATFIGSLAFFTATKQTAGVNSASLVVRAWLIVVAISAPMGLYEIVSGNHFEGAFQDRTIGGIGSFPFAAGFFGNYNDYSAWLSLAVPFTLAALAFERNRYLQVMIAGTIASIFVILVVNTSRGAISASILSFAFFSIRFKEVRYLLFLILPLFIYFAISQFGNDSRDLLELARYRLETTDAQEESVSHRASLIYAGMMAIVESYGLGIGVGGFEEYIISNHPSLIPNAHNIFLEIAVNFGVIPFALFINFLAYLLIFTLKNKNSIPPPFRMSIICSIISMPIIGAVPSHAVGFVYWWVWLGSLVVLANCAVAGDVRLARQS